MNKEQLAWAAGLFDGEGHFRAQYYKNKPHQLRVSFSQKDPEVLYKLQSLFGGNIYKPKNYNHYQYLLSKNDKALNVMAQLWPWLGSKKRQQFKEAMIKFRGGK